ncbi:MAG: hypothetical protein WC969_12600 [Elusimicrobiota bacterium]|jgi:hypothetical protein
MIERILRRPWAPPLLLALAGLLVFGPHAPAAGLHLDDHAFHRLFTLGTPAQVWSEFLSYVPGRNLYILYFSAMYRLFGPAPLGLHLFGLALDLLNGLLVYGLLRRLKAPAGWPLAAAGLFLVWPNHAETHFWTSAVAMNLLSTTSLLLTFHLALAGAARPWLRVLGTLLLYASAFFNYDQVFFMWIPLLFMTWKLAPEAGWRRAHAAAFAAVSLLMGASHALMRVYCPVSSGGRPVVRLAGLLHEAWTSVKACLLPMHKLPVWDCLQSWAGGPVPTVALLLVLSGLWLSAVALRWDDEPPAGAPALGAWAAFGALWTFFAYLPNYFWFISPRHNYLPSVGFILLLCCAATALARMRRGLRVPLAALAFLLFGLGASSGIGEGCGWARSWRLFRRFQAEAPRLVPPETDNLFLLGAPSTLFRAPAFLQPEEHVLLFALATGNGRGHGDTHLCPTRTGAFFLNQADLFGPENFFWRPLRGLRALRYRPEDGGFSCVGALELRLPGGGTQPLRLDAARACPGTQAVETPLWLESARRTSGGGKPLLSADDGAELLEARLERTPGDAARLVLLWRARTRISVDFAATAVILDASGRELWSPVQPESRARRSAHGRVWPLFDDLLPPSTWKPGETVREQYLLEVPRSPGPLQLRLTLFERRDGAAWMKLSQHTLPLEER